MSNSEYRRLDFSMIRFKDKPTPSEAALRDVEPMQWSQDVLSGKKKVIISKTNRGTGKCAK